MSDQSNSEPTTTQALAPRVPSSGALITSPEQFTEKMRVWSGHYNVMSPFTNMSALAPQHGIMCASGGTAVSHALNRRRGRLARRARTHTKPCTLAPCYQGHGRRGVPTQPWWQGVCSPGPRGPRQHRPRPVRRASVAHLGCALLGVLLHTENTCHASGDVCESLVCVCARGCRPCAVLAQWGAVVDLVS